MQAREWIDWRGLFAPLALYVIAQQAVDLVRRYLRVLGEDAGEYADYADVAVLLLVIAGVCVLLRRALLAAAPLAPYYGSLAFAFVLPYLRELLVDALAIGANLWILGQIGSTGEFDILLRAEPLRTMVWIALGIVAAVIWYLAIRRMLGPGVQCLVRRGLTTPRRLSLFWPLLLFAVALPALNWLGTTLFHAAPRWFPSRHAYEFNYLIAIGAIALCLWLTRARIARSDLSPVFVVLAVLLLMQLVYNVIDREALYLVRDFESSPGAWEKWVFRRGAIHHAETAAYRLALYLAGAAAACAILRLALGPDPAAMVRRVEPQARGAD